MRSAEDIKHQIKILHETLDRVVAQGITDGPADQLRGELVALYWVLGHDHKAAIDRAAGDAHDWSP